MKKIIVTVLLILPLSVQLQAQEGKKATSAELQKWIALDKEETRAANDQQVLIVLVQVKEESKDDFDAWIKDVLYAALYKSKSEMKKAQLNAVRWMEPVRQNEDGTWTYSWIMDPIILGTNYDIIPFLTSEYGEEEGMKHWDKYLTFMAAQPQSIMLKQTDY